MDVMIGEIRAFAFNYAPQGWLPCNGANYPVNNYQALFSVLGNTYGGVQNQSFNVPNLQGRVMVGAGQLYPPAGDLNYVAGSVGGAETVGIDMNTVPPHTHAFNAATTIPTTYLATETQVPGNGNSFVSNVFEHVSATTNRTSQGYNNNTAPNTELDANAISIFTGNNAGHENRQPYFVLNYCINWDGDYPSKP